MSGWLVGSRRLLSWLGKVSSILLFVSLISTGLALAWLLSRGDVLGVSSPAQQKIQVLFLFAVLFALLFYLGLRLVVRALLEKSTWLARSSLRVKFTIAFLAFSLPSLVFHALVVGVTTQSLGRISNQQYLKILNHGDYLADILAENENNQLQKFMTNLQLVLPIDEEAYQQQGWMIQSLPGFRGGVVVYGREDVMLSRWISHGDVLETLLTPDADDFIKAREFGSAGVLVSQQVGSFQVRSLLQTLRVNPSLVIQLLQVYPARLTETLGSLTLARDENLNLQRLVYKGFWLFMMAMTVLILLSTFLIARHLTPHFTNPVDHLVEATRKMAKGDFQHRISDAVLENSSRDLQGLMSTFNFMSQRLDHNHQELNARALMVDMLLEHVDAGIVALNTKGRVSALNGTTHKMLPDIPVQWEGKSVATVFGKELAHKIKTMQDVLKKSNDSNHTSNFTLHSPTEDEVLELSLVEIPKEEGSEMLIIIRNATAMQRTQRTLAWREVARRMAHEIKNPLTPIQLCAQRIQRRSQGLTSENAQVVSQCTQTIVQQVNALKNMVKGFSQFAKLPETAFQSADLNLIVAESAQLYSASLAKDIKLTLQLTPQLPTLLLDQEQMRGAIINLLENAITALHSSNQKTPRHITMATHFLTEKQRVQLTIQDNGPGVAENIHQHLFEPYTTSKKQGEGLGLSIVKQIMTDHKGSISYTAVAKGGSLFTLTLPVPHLPPNRIITKPKKKPYKLT